MHLTIRTHTGTHIFKKSLLSVGMSDMSDMLTAIQSCRMPLKGLLDAYAFGHHAENLQKVEFLSPPHPVVERLAYASDIRSRAAMP